MSWTAYTLQGNPLKNLLLLRETLLKTEQFHFFTEPWAPLVVRVKGGEGINPVLNELGIDWKFDEYPEEGEVEAFGDQWEIIASLLHAGGILSLYWLDKEWGNSARPSKILHCLMNQFGYGYGEEAMFYSQMGLRSLSLAVEYTQGRMRRDYKGNPPSVTVRGTWTERG